MDMKRITLRRSGVTLVVFENIQLYIGGMMQNEMLVATAIFAMSH